ncbi:hypothetical protein TURU_008916 [Turdus rufiventris]|nr:hypothetical protein TURU_008916 [Turdus rufiventris]
MKLGTGELVEVHDQSMGSNDDPSTSEMLPESKLFEVTEAELAHLQADEEQFHAKLLRHSKRKIMGGNVIGNGGGAFLCLNRRTGNPPLWTLIIKEEEKGFTKHLEKFSWTK